ncbi:MAG: nucleotidyltransferase family protein, partial [Anaerolineae bacterium]|nr:nucleotidyltransferase family protein [Anaerolineae bacterium]
MSSPSDQNDTFGLYLLLAACAQPVDHPAQRRQICRLARRQTGWDTLIEQAEQHGLGPLLYQHSRAGGITWPDPIKRALQGLYVRHRHANQVRAAALGEILRMFQGAGVEVLVLKGAALAHLVYP